MGNRILRIMAHRKGWFNACEPELNVVVTPETLTPTTELRGRLTGPRCPYAATVEVAYPLRPLPGPAPTPGALGARVVVPEASFWDPETPFLYVLTVELWQDGRRCDQAVTTRGFRSTALGRAGLRVNGRPLTLRGRETAACDDAEVLALRRAGFNLLLSPTADAAAPLMERADRLGFFVLTRLAGAVDTRLVNEWLNHPSHFGVLLVHDWQPPECRPPLGKVGIALDGPPPGPVRNANFLACPASLAARSGPLGLPLLLLGPGPDVSGSFGRVE
jgi:hypothetical protein